MNTFYEDSRLADTLTSEENDVATALHPQWLPLDVRRRNWWERSYPTSVVHAIGGYLELVTTSEPNGPVGMIASRSLGALIRGICSPLAGGAVDVRKVAVDLDHVSRPCEG